MTRLLGDNKQDPSFFGLGSSAPRDMSGHTRTSRVQPVDIYKQLLKSKKLIQQEDLQIGRKVDEGDVGKIFQATFQGRRVACKRIKHGEGSVHAATDYGKMAYEQATVDMMREIAALSTLNPHPNVVHFLGICATDENNPILVEDYLAGVSLKNFLDGGLSCGDRPPLPDKTVWGWVLQLFRGLQALHTNEPLVIHRDIKPANVMICHELTTVVITDFGTAKRIPKEERAIIEMHRAGNIMYMAPEVLSTGSVGTSHYDEKCDIYSAGLLSWRIATRLPIIRSPARHHEFPNIHKVKLAGLQPILSQCWSLSPSARPSAKVVLSMMESMADKPVVEVSP
eukprot:CAMPEP_0173414070 /NCGR_PEP_ID=MMETSP1356-20130122/83572_1 /TAXON_ID=77927 ORGANISM="Hemiselmis virescens, Strain PCC157" /NCGR_SAMPLE_ID=MMETSP1356 /ASSEMBLY_ACC=CAM_ASM_000847 /LENGTH=338 /DNA_ID=CAMNT_0014376187 /DNA_START=116 /DNA_END=1128 /DNA_ORIENTATION=-